MTESRDREPAGRGGPDRTGSAFQTRDADPRASSTIIVAIVGALSVFVIIVALQAVFYNTEETERVSKVYDVVPQELAKLRANQQEQLNTYRWVDQTRGIASIPIDRAMELVVRDQAKSSPAVGEGSRASERGEP